MLCIQNISNLFRKTAFARLLATHAAATAAHEEEKSARGGDDSNNAEEEEEEDEEEGGGGGGNNDEIGDVGSGPEPDDPAATAAAAAAAAAPKAGSSLSANRPEELVVFDEDIDFSLAEAVPDPVPFLEKLKVMLDDHKQFLRSKESSRVADSILEEVRRNRECCLVVVRSRVA
jgi:hypothetical protein